MTKEFLRVDQVVAWMILEIDSAFPGEDPPAADNIVAPHALKSHPERDQILDFLCGRRWRDISADDLLAYRGVETAILTSLTVDAFCYYLPAFLTACLRNGEWADTSFFWWFSKFPEPKDELERLEKLHALSDAQLETVANTARVLTLIRGPDYEHSRVVSDIGEFLRSRDRIDLQKAASKSSVHESSLLRSGLGLSKRSTLIVATDTLLRAGNNQNFNRGLEILVSELRSRQYNIVSMIAVGASCYMSFFYTAEDGCVRHLEAIFFDCCRNSYWPNFRNTSTCQSVLAVEYGFYGPGARRPFKISFETGGNVASVEIRHRTVKTNLQIGSVRTAKNVNS